MILHGLPRRDFIASAYPGNSIFGGNGRLGILNYRWMMEIIIGRRPRSRTEGFALRILLYFIGPCWPQGITHILNPVRFFDNYPETIVFEFKQEKSDRKTIAIVQMAFFFLILIEPSTVIGILTLADNLSVYSINRLFWKNLKLIVIKVSSDEIVRKPGRVCYLTLVGKKMSRVADNSHLMGMSIDTFSW